MLVLGFGLLDDDGFSLIETATWANLMGSGWSTTVGARVERLER